MSCTGTTPTCTNIELNTVYPSSILPSSLPTINGDILAPDTVTSIINGLYSSGKLPAIPALETALNKSMDEITTYNTQMLSFFTNLQEEYNYYYARYIFELNRVLTLFVDANNVSTIGLNRDSLISSTRAFNIKLNALMQIAQKVGSNTYSNSSDIQTKITTINSNLNDKAAIIKNTSTLINSNMSNMEIRKQMVEYTREKSKVTDNLLSLYFVLNAFAIGALIYVYKA
jgi:hypothetical protein